MENILYNKDGSIKPFYILSSERDIKETQIRSDENELDYDEAVDLLVDNCYGV